MTTIDTHASNAPSEGSVLACIAEWVTTTDHKRIGRLYLAGGVVALIGAAAVAVLLGLERVTTSSRLFDVDVLTNLFALERFGLIYLALAPLVIGAALAVVPLQLGSRSLAFPRLAAAGFWAWLVGAVLAVYALLSNGGPNGTNPRFVDMFTLSATMVIVGLVASVVCLATTVLTTRAPGMNMRRIPFFSWSVLIFALAALVALPVVAGDLLFTYVAFRYPSPDNVLSSGHAIGEWVGFGFSQPTTLVFLLPVFGFFAEVAATASGKRLQPRGVLYAALGLVGVSCFATLVQAPITLRPGFSGLTLGDKLSDLLPFALVHGLPLLGALLVLAITARQLASTKRLYSVPAFVPTVYGVLAALVALSAVAASALVNVGDAALVGTSFEEGNLLAVVAAGAMAAMGAVVLWGPKWWGGTLSAKATLPLALLVFVGAELASLPLLVAGFADQPGAIFPGVVSGPGTIVNFEYGGNAELWNLFSTVGLGMILLAVVSFALVAIRSFLGAHTSEPDPWNGQTLEWATSSPAPAANFATVHIVASAEPVLDLEQRSNA